MSAQLCADSATIDAEPVITAAAVLATAMSPLTTKANTTVNRLSPDLLDSAGDDGGSSAKASDSAGNRQPASSCSHGEPRSWPSRLARDGRGRGPSGSSPGVPVGRAGPVNRSGHW